MSITFHFVSVATEFPGTLPTAEETTNSDMVEEMAVMGE